MSTKYLALYHYNVKILFQLWVHIKAIFGEYASRFSKSDDYDINVTI